jgi:hypothetical protein
MKPVAERPFDQINQLSTLRRARVGELEPVVVTSVDLRSRPAAAHARYQGRSRQPSRDSSFAMAKRACGMQSMDECSSCLCRRRLLPQGTHPETYYAPGCQGRDGGFSRIRCRA